MSDTYNPTIIFRDAGDENNITAIVKDSDPTASNEIYIRARYSTYDDNPNAIVVGDDSVDISLGTPNFYYAKLISTVNDGDTNESIVTTDEVILEVLSATPDSDISDGGTKIIKNVEVESITNTFFGNQFLGYFIKIPQVGYYQDVTSKSLKPYVTDRINESIRGIQLPETAIHMIAIPYYAHQNEQFMGVGDGELGQISLRFKLDRYLQNYTSLLNWSFLKYDWTFGGKNPLNTMTDHDLHGTFIVEFLDADEQRTRKIAYKIIIDSLPGISLAVDTSEDVEFEVLFRVVNIDTSQFVMGDPLNEHVRIF